MGLALLYPSQADQVVHRGTRVTTVSQLIPSLVKPICMRACVYLKQELCSNLVSARPAGVDEPWQVLTDFHPHVTNSELLCQQILH